MDEPGLTSGPANQSGDGNISQSIDQSFRFDELITSTPKRELVRQPRVDDLMFNINSFRKGGPKEHKITNAIIYFIVTDDLALNTTEKKGFQYLMKELCPHYCVPSRNTITRQIDEKYDALSVIIKERLKKVSSFCLTSDIWTDTMNTRSYLGLTCHYLEENILKSTIIGVHELDERHTSEYIKNIIEKLCKDWDIDKEKILATVTDNGANIVKAIHDFLGRNKHLPCFAHTLNLVVQKAIDDTRGLETLVNKVKQIVTYFKQSVVAHDELIKCQKNHNVEPKKLIQDVITRWNSKLYMLERFIELADYIGTILLQNAKAPAMLTGTEMAIIKELIQILSPIENVTKEISGQEYATSSIIIPIIYCMTKAIELANSENASEYSDLGSEFKAKILNEINKRFRNTEKVHILAISTILDPRFKKIHFTDAQACAKAISDISELLKSTTSLTTAPTASTSQGANTPSAVSNIWKFHKELVSQSSQSEPKERMDDILKQYLREPLVEKEVNPILYWTTRKSIWPDLSDLALRYLSVVATSVPSERLFSLAGHTLSESRNRLNPQRLSKLLFLRCLSADQWQL